jgi:hypothetical protein
MNNLEKLSAQELASMYLNAKKADNPVPRLIISRYAFNHPDPNFYNAFDTLTREPYLIDLVEDL